MATHSMEWSDLYLGSAYYYQPFDRYRPPAYTSDNKLLYGYNGVDYMATVIKISVPFFPGESEYLEIAMDYACDKDATIFWALCTSDEKAREYAMSHGSTVSDETAIKTGSLVLPEYGAIGDNLDVVDSFSLTIQTTEIEANKDHYLILWHGDKNGAIAYFKKRTSGASLRLAYNSGLVYIDTGSGFTAYQGYIDNGTSWDLAVPYIDSGTNWDMYS